MRKFLLVLLGLLYAGTSIAQIKEDIVYSSDCTIDDYRTYNNVTINTGVTVTIASTGKLTVGNTITNKGTLVLENGGQLVGGTAKLSVTVRKTINAYKWYTISSPVKAAITGAFEGTAGDDYDAYFYNEPTCYWLSYEVPGNASLFTERLGTGYLYAKEVGGYVEFSGKQNSSSSYSVNVSCKLSEENPLRGFNLIGNPYLHDIYKGWHGVETCAISDAKLASGYYVLNGDDSWVTCTYTRSIKPGEGILVKTTETRSVTIEKKDTQADGDESGGAKGDNKELLVSVKGNSGEDKAYVYFYDGIGLDKIDHISQTVPNLCVINDDKKYAIAHVEPNCSSVDVLFNSNQREIFTITVKPVKGNFDYLHLIDNLTGDDIDLLQEPSYRFASSGNDYDSRFKLIMKQNNGVSPDNSSFAYLSNDDIIVTGVHGMATLQIFDVMGRMVSSDVITGIDGSVCRVRKPYSTGVYILRLIENNNASTQKIVVE